MMGDIDVRQVCKICYVSSSHKPNPILTPETKATFNGNCQTCSVCRQGWASIRVAKDSGPAGCGRWVRIRPRPRISASTEFQTCKNVQGGRGDCPRGLDCSYAHYRVELALWNAERKLEPRPAPPITGSYQYQLCKHMQGAGHCPYGQRCTFAHSEEEYHQWLRSMPPTATAVPMTSLRCDICSLTCTSKRQLEDHLAGGKHRDRLQGGHDQAPGPPPSVTPQFNTSAVRKRPLLSFQIVGFKMCMHVLANRRCVYGEFCTFAHSEEELQVWNRQLSFSPHQTMHQNILRFQAPPPPPTYQGKCTIIMDCG